jgi:hypothetical protein
MADISIYGTLKNETESGIIIYSDQALYKNREVDGGTEKVSVKQALDELDEKIGDIPVPTEVKYKGKISVEGLSQLVDPSEDDTYSVFNSGSEETGWSLDPVEWEGETYPAGTFFVFTDGIWVVPVDQPDFTNVMKISENPNVILLVTNVRTGGPNNYAGSQVQGLPICDLASFELVDGVYKPKVETSGTPGGGSSSSSTWQIKIPYAGSYSSGGTIHYRAGVLPQDLVQRLYESYYQVISDWNESNPNSKAFIANKPTHIIVLDSNVLKDKDTGNTILAIDSSIPNQPESNHVLNTPALVTELNKKENTSNKVTTISRESTDNQYPTAKAVYDKLSEQEYYGVERFYYGVSDPRLGITFKFKSSDGINFYMIDPDESNYFINPLLQYDNYGYEATINSDLSYVAVAGVKSNAGTFLFEVWFDNDYDNRYEYRMIVNTNNYCWVTKSVNAPDLIIYQPLGTKDLVNHYILFIEVKNKNGSVAHSRYTKSVNDNSSNRFVAIVSSGNSWTTWWESGHQDQSSYPQTLYQTNTNPFIGYPESSVSGCGFDLINYNLVPNLKLIDSLHEVSEIEIYSSSLEHIDTSDPRFQYALDAWYGFSTTFTYDGVAYTVSSVDLKYKVSYIDNLIHVSNKNTGSGGGGGSYSAGYGISIQSDTISAEVEYHDSSIVSVSIPWVSNGIPYFPEPESTLVNGTTIFVSHSGSYGCWMLVGDTFVQIPDINGTYPDSDKCLFINGVLTYLFTKEDSGQYYGSGYRYMGNEWQLIEDASFPQVWSADYLDGRYAWINPNDGLTHIDVSTSSWIIQSDSYGFSMQDWTYKNRNGILDGRYIFINKVNNTPIYYYKDTNTWILKYLDVNEWKGFEYTYTSIPEGDDFDHRYIWYHNNRTYYSHNGINYVMNSNNTWTQVDFGSVNNLVNGSKVLNYRGKTYLIIQGYNTPFEFKLDRYDTNHGDELQIKLIPEYGVNTSGSNIKSGDYLILPIPNDNSLIYDNPMYKYVYDRCKEDPSFGFNVVLSTKQGLFRVAAVSAIGAEVTLDSYYGTLSIVNYHAQDGYPEI